MKLKIIFMYHARLTILINSPRNEIHETDRSKSPISVAFNPRKNQSERHRDSEFSTGEVEFRISDDRKIVRRLSFFRGNLRPLNGRADHGRLLASASLIVSALWRGKERSAVSCRRGVPRRERPISPLGNIDVEAALLFVTKRSILSTDMQIELRSVNAHGARELATFLFFFAWQPRRFRESRAIKVSRNRGNPRIRWCCGKLKNSSAEDFRSFDLRWWRDWRNRVPFEG